MAGNDISYKVSVQGSTIQVAGPNHTTQAEIVSPSNLPNTKKSFLEVSDPLSKKTATLTYYQPSGDLKAGRDALIRAGYQMQTVDTAKGPVTVFVYPQDWKNFQGALKDLKANHTVLKAAADKLDKIKSVKSEGVSHPLFAGRKPDGLVTARKPQGVESDKAKAARAVMGDQLDAMTKVLKAKPSQVAGKGTQPRPAGN